MIEKERSCKGESLYRVRGIGCRTLEKYVKLSNNDMSNCLFFYINHEDMGIDDKYTYVIPNIPEGTGTFRCIGQNAVRYEIYTGTMKHFFEEIQNIQQLELIFVVSSFGGFGSAALLPVLDYVEAITWGLWIRVM